MAKYSNTIIQQKIQVWFETLQKLSEFEQKLEPEEQTIKEFLKDYWRNYANIGDDDGLCKSYLEELKGYKKHHPKEPEITTNFNELRGIAEKMFLSDNETYHTFQQMAHEYVKQHKPKAKPQKKPKEQQQVPSLQEIFDASQSIYYDGGDLQTAYQGFLMCAQGGIAYAYFYLGSMEADGKVGTANPTKAFQYYKAGAEGGNSTCQCLLALYYEQGKGTAVNFDQAIYWYNKAIDNGGNEFAKFRLALVLVQNDREPERAFKLFKSVADSDSDNAPFARLSLGHCYEWGIGVPQDMQRAYNIYQQELQKGTELASGYLKDWNNHNQQIQRSRQKPSTSDDFILSPEGQKENEILSREFEQELARSFGETTSTTNSTKPQTTIKEKSNDGCWGCLVWIIVAAVIYWGYKSCTNSNWSLFGSDKEDATKPHSYILAETLNLRSSSEKNSYNIIGKLNYGTPVTASNNVGNGNWVQITADGQSGYVSSSGIVDEIDFQALNKLWGDDATRRIVAELRYRRALIALTKTSAFSDGYKLYGLENRGNNVWRSKTLGGCGAFAVILDNKAEGRRLAAVYSFDNADNPICQFTEFINGETTYINKVTFKRNNYLINYGTYKTSESIDESQVIETIDDGEQSFSSSDNGLLESLPYGTTMYEGVMAGYPIHFSITKDKSNNEVRAVYKNVSFGGTINLTGESTGGEIHFTGLYYNKPWRFNLKGTKVRITGTAYGDDKVFELVLRPR